MQQHRNKPCRFCHGVAGNEKCQFCFGSGRFAEAYNEGLDERVHHLATFMLILCAIALMALIVAKLCS
jgi:hypothetical protein